MNTVPARSFHDRSRLRLVALVVMSSTKSFKAWDLIDEMNFETCREWNEQFR